MLNVFMKFSLKLEEKMSAGPGFNLSTKKEDLSTKLKTQNLKRAKHETRRLEEEGKKMEERLMELKLAMNREKEERERQGGGFWKSGQQGTLNHYAEEVLAKKKSKSAPTKGKIKILRDKPLDIPERSNQPGTMAYIAQKGSHTPRDKPKGPRCGQCEERSAAVSCVQCSEDYCAGCFAAFHLKGNLKKHRSVPLTATPRQCFASPRPPQASISYDYGGGEEGGALHVPESARKKDRNSPEGASGTYENSLLHGSYNEAEQAASFQDALQAWRTGKSADNVPNSASNSGGSRPSTDRSQKRGGVPYSPVQTPTVNVDSSTGTSEGSHPVEIKFNTGSMTYAERLLLKKHRRTDVEELFTPRGGERSVTATPRYTPRQTTRSRNILAREASDISLKIEEFNDGDFEERVNFDSLLDAVRQVEGEPAGYKDPDTISIVEVNESLQADPSQEQVVAYKIQEDGGQESWSTDIQNDVKPQLIAKPPSNGKSSRRKSGRKSARSSLESSINESQLTDSARLRSSKTVSDSSEFFNNKDSDILGARLKDIENEVKKEDVHLISARSLKSSRSSKENKIEKTMSQERSALAKENIKLSKENSNMSEQKNVIVKENTDLKTDKQTKVRPDSSQAKPKSARSRPQTGNKTQSKQGTQSRMTSRQGSRPSSRTTSRLGSSRASSRIENPGLLTKAPSEALKEIARMTPTQDTYKGIDSFFMVGVQPAQQEERTLTPTQHKEKEEKIKVSYQLYSMAPRSWKPDFSMTDAVDVDDVENDEADDDRASSVMAYHAYSEQLVSDITERLFSRFDELPLDDDSLSDQSSGGAYRSLGEEYRNFTPRSHSHGSSVQNSPSMSGRGTPIQIMRSQVRDSVQTPRKPPVPSQPQHTPVPPPTQTPRQSARSRAKTPQLSKSRAEVNTPRRSKTFHGEIERPESRAIVMEGTDLSIFDTVGETDNRDTEDKDALDKLEWELASQSGRLTADGKISRMEMPEDISDDSINSSLESFRSMSRLGQDQGYDINSKLRRDELEDDDTVTDDESDVRNLM